LVAEKIKAIEIFDEKIVGSILKNLDDAYNQWRIMVLSDLVTPVSLKRHVGDPVPFSIMGSGIKEDSLTQFNEVTVKKGGYKLSEGYKLMSKLVSAQHK